MTAEDIKAIRKMMEFLVRKEISQSISKLSVQEKKVYDLTGVNGVPVTEIVKKSGFSAGKISGLWQKWEGDGLLIKKGKSYEKVI